MRGLKTEELAFMKAQDYSCGGCASNPEFTTGEESMARGLAVRGLLSLEQCNRTAGAQHFTPTADGRTLMFVYDQLLSLYGGPG